MERTTASPAEKVTYGKNAGLRRMKNGEKGLPFEIPGIKSKTSCVSGSNNPNIYATLHDSFRGDSKVLFTWTVSEVEFCVWSTGCHLLVEGR